MLSWILGVLLAINVADAVDTIRIPLISQGRVNEQAMLRSSLARRKVGYSSLVDHVVFQGAFLDLAYLGLVSIGTPPQSFLLDIDTGSGALWVADLNCRGCNVSTAHLFDQSLSSTLKKLGVDIQFLYGTGAVQCNALSDTVLFGGISMDNFNFGSCYAEQDWLFPESVGIIGIGFPQSTITPSWIVEAYKRSLIPAPAYSLSLGRYGDLATGKSNDGSLMVIGGYDQDLVNGSINWISCSASIHPQIPLDGIIVNGNTIKRVDNRPMQAIIDSGTGGILPGPSNIVQAVYSLIPGAQPAAGNPGVYVFPCSSTVQIGFQFGGQNYMMNADDFIGIRQGNICVGALVGQDIIDDTQTELGFILGALFMKNVVTVFDLGKPAVGFGSLKAAGKSYGDATIVPDTQATALGTGPSASLNPTFNPPRATAGGSGNGGPQPNPVTVVPGTAPVNPNLSGLAAASGVPTSAGASIAIVSNIPAGTATVAVALPSGTNSINNFGPVVTVLSTVTAGSNSASSSLAPGSVRSEISLWSIIGSLTITLLAII